MGLSTRCGAQGVGAAGPTPGDRTIDDAAVEVGVDDPALRWCLAEALGDVALGAGDVPVDVTAPLLVKVE